MDLEDLQTAMEHLAEEKKLESLMLKEKSAYVVKRFPWDSILFYIPDKAEKTVTSIRGVYGGRNIAVQLRNKTIQYSGNGKQLFVGCFLNIQTYNDLNAKNLRNRLHNAADKGNYHRTINIS